MFARSLRTIATAAAVSRPVARQPLAMAVARPLFAPKASIFFAFQPRTLCAQTFLDAAQVTDRTVEVIKALEKVDPSKVSPTANFTEDLGMDSLDLVEALMALEEEFVFEFPDDEAGKSTSPKSCRCQHGTSPGQ
jgi:NADH dehydrogenase (ubiquinone) 1 alpha/beta subcomplex 1